MKASQAQAVNDPRRLLTPRLRASRSSDWHQEWMENLISSPCLCWLLPEPILHLKSIDPAENHPAHAPVASPKIAIDPEKVTRSQSTEPVVLRLSLAFEPKILHHVAAKEMKRTRSADRLGPPNLERKLQPPQSTGANRSPEEAMKETSTFHNLTKTSQKSAKAMSSQWLPP